MAASLPWMPWFPSDFLSSSKVQRMTLAEQGAYRRLLDYQWMDGNIPESIDEIARLLGVGLDDASRLWGRVGVCFAPCPGGLRNERLATLRDESAIRHQQLSESGKEGASRRWAGHGEANGVAMARPMASTTTTTTIKTTTPTPPTEGGVITSETEKGNGSNGHGFHPKHDKTTALSDYHSRAVKHWKADANMSPSSVRSLRSFDALLLTDARDFDHTKEILAWIFRGQPGDYAPVGEFDWRPNLLSGDSVRRAWDKLDILFLKALEPANERPNRHV